MKRLEPPTLDPSDVYDICVSGVQDDGLRARFQAAKSDVADQISLYKENATQHNLSCFKPTAHGQPNQKITANITKADFVSLYSVHMAPANSSGRLQYEQLRTLDDELCPYCGFGHVETLDHFLAKAYFPIFSVHPHNLVPSCFPCNKKKAGGGGVHIKETSHPYFEVSEVETDQWLHAEVVPAHPPRYRYFFEAPEDWTESLSTRVFEHFDKLELAKRFSVQAFNELAGQGVVWRDLKTRTRRRAHYLGRANSERAHMPNTWVAALYDALYRSDWFLEYAFS